VRSLAQIEARLSDLLDGQVSAADAPELLQLAEEVLEHWAFAHGEIPTRELREGFRLLALHRQGARNEPSFNACRETCRELAYHYNLLVSQAEHPQTGGRAQMMARLANHLYLFVTGKLQAGKLGEFCCAARPLRAQAGESGAGTAFLD
jgi:hypothetical protein